MADEEFPAFELIPADVDTISPDDELADLISPDAVPDLEDPEDDRLPLGFTWFRDYDGGVRTGAPHAVSGVDSVVQIAQVALRTRRGDNPIFDDEFGMDTPESLIGRAEDAELRATYLRDVTETLLACHDRISAVSDILFLHDPDNEIAYLDVTIEIDGDDEVRLEGVPLSA